MEGAYMKNVCNPKLVYCLCNPSLNTLFPLLSFFHCPYVCLFYPTKLMHTNPSFPSPSVFVCMPAAASIALTTDVVKSPHTSMFSVDWSGFPLPLPHYAAAATLSCNQHATHTAIIHIFTIPYSSL